MIMRLEQITKPFLESDISIKDFSDEENISKINDLLELKNVSVIYDLIQCIFINDETNERLFYANKLDDRYPIEIQLEITNDIIEKLTAL
jgi:hypothetical protein